MKFGKELIRTVEEAHPAWKKYAVDYKALKKTLPKVPSSDKPLEEYVAFWEIFESSQQDLDEFYKHKEKWAVMKHATLTKDVEQLSNNLHLSSSTSSIEEMKEHLMEFRTEVEVVREFLNVNQRAFYKILKKFDKRTFSRVRETKLAVVMETHIYLDCVAMDTYLNKIDAMISQLDDLLLELKPMKAGQKRRLESRGVLQEKAAKVLSRLQEESPFFADHPSRKLPSVCQKEIETYDGILGQGKYCFVQEIKAFHFTPAETDEDKLSLRDTSEKYAIKKINDYLKTSSKVDGAIDLAIEAKFLASLNHSNIISLKGTPTGNSPYFLVLDRLFGSLEDKIFKEWYPASTKHKFIILKKKKNSRKQLWNIRIKALMEIARGLEYLHSHNIIHRDLKPANIGFDSCRVAKIFDFGLVKELQPKDYLGENEFRATGRTGTRKYMAPEAILYKPYGKPIDVYSFAITIWETLSLKKVFEGMTLQTLNKEVLGAGRRPTIPRKWPFREVLEKSWATDPRQRPTIGGLLQVLESHFLGKDEGEENDCLDTDVSSERTEQCERIRHDNNN